MRELSARRERHCRRMPDSGADTGTCLLRAPAVALRSDMTAALMEEKDDWYSDISWIT